MTTPSSVRMVTRFAFHATPTMFNVPVRGAAMVPAVRVPWPQVSQGVLVCKMDQSDGGLTALTTVRPLLKPLKPNCHGCRRVWLPQTPVSTTPTVTPDPLALDQACGMLWNEKFQGSRLPAESRGRAPVYVVRSHPDPDSTLGPTDNGSR